MQDTKYQPGNVYSPSNSKDIDLELLKCLPLQDADYHVGDVYCPVYTPSPPTNIEFELKCLPLQDANYHVGNIQCLKQTDIEFELQQCLLDFDTDSLLEMNDLQLPYSNDDSKLPAISNVESPTTSVNSKHI